MIAVGVMSGTSLDGIGAALVSMLPNGRGYAIELMRFETFAFDAAVLAELRAILPPNRGSVAETARAHRALGEVFAAAARSVAGSHPIRFIASHGQTIYHDGERSTTLQIGDAFVIRERAGATVCYDFRSADCAAGGHGAPLIPYVDALLFGRAGEDRLAVNLGGIANVTLLGAGGDVSAFDTGPGVMLLDAFVRTRTGGRTLVDAGGRLAAKGIIDDQLLEELLSNAYFAQAPPKSTGRETFGEHFLAQHDARLSRLSLEDGLATLAELTAASLANAVSGRGFAPARVIVSGGGCRNRHLLARVAARLSPAPVETSDAMGFPAEAKEAIGFAVLGYETLRGRVANVPRATGATHAVPLGAIAPYRLPELFAEVERECRGLP